MELKKATDCDVLVLGSGIAGISAALRAAELGARVILACKGPLFSGSSFYPGTWGLGLIGPENEADKKDLAETILRVGQGMADPKLVETFVGGIAPAIENLRKKGVRLRRANQAGQKEFIPCFDHKHRDWNGIEFEFASSPAGRPCTWSRIRGRSAEPFFPKRSSFATLPPGRWCWQQAAMAVCFSTTCVRRM